MLNFRDMLNFRFFVMLLFLLILDEFSVDKFKTQRLFIISIFILLLRIAGIVELELITSLKTILFQLTEIKWSFEMFYFFAFRSQLCK